VNLSRRCFVKLAAAAVPFASGVGGCRTLEPTWEPGGIPLGVQTYSFRDMLSTPGDMVDKMIAAMLELGLKECEVFEPTLQPPSLSADAPWRMVAGKPTEASLLGRPPVGAPTSAQRETQEGMRKWRLGEGLEQVKTAGDKFRRAGIRVRAFNYLLKDWCTDDEVEVGLKMTRALGADIMTASTTLSMARRCVPLVKKHEVFLAMHGHSNLSDPNQFATPDSFAQALAMSRYYRVNLDVGHFFASGFDPVGYISANHRWITNLHIKDRKRNDGPNMPFGRGDTPIAAIMQLLKEQAWAIPSYIEYEYAGKGSSTWEVGQCLAYVKSVLA
jgi:sugar phosphate isomerase/epimerase